MESNDPLLEAQSELAKSNAELREAKAKSNSGFWKAVGHLKLHEMGKAFYLGSLIVLVIICQVTLPMVGLFLLRDSANFESFKPILEGMSNPNVEVWVTLLAYLVGSGTSEKKD